MNIAMVEQSRIDAYLDRVQRFVDGVHSLEERLTHLLGARTTTQEEQTASFHTYQPTEPASIPKPELVSQTSSYESRPSAPVSAPVTADDVDIDAILSDISLDSELGL